MVDKAACECGCHAGKVGISAVSLTFCYGYLRKSHSLRKNISAMSGRRPECSARGDAFARHDDRYSLSRVFRSLRIFRPLPCVFAWERVPDRAGEGSWMKDRSLDLLRRRCPHPAFGHLLPSFGREKAIGMCRQFTLATCRLGSACQRFPARFLTGARAVPRG